MDLTTIVVMTLLQITGTGPTGLTQVDIVDTQKIALEQCWETAGKVNADPATPFVVVCSPVISNVQANENTPVAPTS